MEKSVSKVFIEKLLKQIEEDKKVEAHNEGILWCEAQISLLKFLLERSEENG